MENLSRFVLPDVSPVSLPAVSLVVETRPEMMPRIRRITEWHRRWFKFHREVVISQDNPGIPGTSFVSCGRPPEGRRELVSWYSDMCIRWLNRLCDAPFMLLWQWDGFVLNPECWSDEFMEWDYVGAPMVCPELFQKISYLEQRVPGWKRPFNGPAVGNGGFSLRSRRFLEASASLPEGGVALGVEDFYLCVETRRELEGAGMRFAPLPLADRFSTERSLDNFGRRFGFHGLESIGDAKRLMESRYLPA